MATTSELTEAIRGVLNVFESGTTSQAQLGAIQRVRVIIGDVPAPGCLHDAGDYRDNDDVLRCALCAEDLGAEAAPAAPASANETPSQED